MQNNRFGMAGQLRNTTARDYFLAPVSGIVRDRTARSTSASNAQTRFRQRMRNVVAAAGMSIAVTVAFYWLIRFLKSISIAIH